VLLSLRAKGRISAFRTERICSKANLFSRLVFEQTQSHGTQRRKSRMYASLAVNKTQLFPAMPVMIRRFREAFPWAFPPSLRAANRVLCGTETTSASIFRPKAITLRRCPKDVWKCVL
jgi:hypothetical protein